MPERRAPLPLTDAWCARLSALLAEAPINLVSRRDRSDVRRLHVDESVAIAQHLRIRDGAAWLDLGTGGGLPGLVLAAAFPTVAWTLLDAREKKLVQVAGFAAVLGVDNVTTLHGRAEKLADERAYAGRFDGVIARAVAPLPQTVALARPFVTRGELVAVRGPRALEEVKVLVPWSDHLGVTVDTVSRIGGTIRPTWLVRLQGRGPVPARFPQVRKQLLQNKGNARHYSGAIRPEADMPGTTGESPQGTSEEA